MVSMLIVFLCSLFCLYMLHTSILIYLASSQLVINVLKENNVYFRLACIALECQLRYAAFLYLLACIFASRIHPFVVITHQLYDQSTLHPRNTLLLLST